MSTWPEEDKKMHQALMKVMNEATFKLKGVEVVAFSKVYLWASNMPHNYDKKPEKKKVKHGLKPQ